MLTDWLMLIVTAVYVVATIFICVYNGRSAKWAKEQTEAARQQTKEMIDQYNATNRPFVTIRFDVIRSGLLCFVIENEGSQPAKDVKIRINTEFIENISGSENQWLRNLNEACLYLACKQKVTVFLGGQLSFEDIAKETAKIDISYNGIYSEHTEIDLNQYKFLMVYNSPTEDISQHIKKIKEESANFHKSLIKTMERPSQIQNVVIHSATENDANKFKLFKEVCMDSGLTLSKLSEKIGLDKDYTLQLLIELSKVDQLIAYRVQGFDDDYEKVLWYKR